MINHSNALFLITANTYTWKVNDTKINTVSEHVPDISVTNTTDELQHSRGKDNTVFTLKMP